MYTRLFTFDVYEQTRVSSKNPSYVVSANHILYCYYWYDTRIVFKKITVHLSTTKRINYYIYIYTHTFIQAYFVILNTKSTLAESLKLV